MGADFLNKFKLLIDIHNRKLIDDARNISIQSAVMYVLKVK